MIKSSKLSFLLATVLVGSAIGGASVMAADGNMGPQAAEPKSPVGTLYGSALLWAVIKADGTIARSDGAYGPKTGKVGTGQYEVGFYRNVRGCVYVAAIGGSANLGVPPTGQIVVEGRFNNVNGVYVQTSNSSGQTEDRPFHLFVNC